MKENLSITINGLEYIAKTEQKSEQYYLNRELLLSEEIENLRNEINELEEENGKLFSRINELEDILADIRYMANQC